MSNQLDRPTPLIKGVDRNGRYEIDFDSLYPFHAHKIGSSNTWNMGQPTLVAALPIRGPPKNLGMHYQRFDNIQASTLANFEQLFDGVRWDCKATYDFTRCVTLTAKELSLTMDDRRFAILAHMALQQRFGAFDELDANERFTVPMTTDVRFVASSSRGMPQTMILRLKLDILAGQWIVRIPSAVCTATTTGGVAETKSDSWIGLTPNGVEVHLLDEWIVLAHDRTLVELMQVDTRYTKYDTMQIEATIGRWASFAKFRSGPDKTVEFETREWLREPYGDNFQQVSTEKTFPGVLAYARDTKNPLHDALTRSNSNIIWREHRSYTAGGSRIDNEGNLGKKEKNTSEPQKNQKDVDSSADDSSDKSTPRPATEKDFGKMTSEEAKRQEYRDKLRTRHRRKKQTL